nr:EOG090X0BTZ [Lepidurus arcticus]
MSASVEEVITHYQKKLEKYASDEKVVIHCLSKLDKLSINVQHLQATGIGRNINSIRKTEGQVGEKARALVQKWKAIVAAEDQSSEGEQAAQEREQDGDDKNISQFNSHSQQSQAGQSSPRLKNSDKNPNSTSRSKNSVQDKTHSKEPKDKDKHRKSSSESSRSKDRHQQHDTSPSKAVSEVRNSDQGKKRKKEDTLSDNNDSDAGVTNESGASFAQALGNLDTAVRSKKPHKEKKKEAKSKVKQSSSATYHDHSVKTKLEPLDLDLSSLSVPSSSSSSSLPVLNTNYRPLPRPMDCPTSSLKKRVHDEEALAKVMHTKGARTKVYSGVKSTGLTHVPSLFDLCMRVLQDNIDCKIPSYFLNFSSLLEYYVFYLALEYTGGVPYDVLKPVLDRATPTQLFWLENYNPYLLEDSDELWKFHSERQFKGRERQEMETWRELYIRCHEEQEARLKSLTANIQSSMAKAKPVRQTKLAYVESTAKPPRGVARAQVKHGTSAAAAAVMQKTAMGQIKGASRPFESGEREEEEPGERIAEMSFPFLVTAKKPKVAPLMQKTLKLIKNRYRR